MTPPDHRPEFTTPATTKIVSWMGGEHWYIGNLQFMRLEEAIAFCVKSKLEYEVIADPKYYARSSGD